MLDEVLERRILIIVYINFSLFDLLFVLCLSHIILFYLRYFCFQYTNVLIIAIYMDNVGWQILLPLTLWSLYKAHHDIDTLSPARSTHLASPHPSPLRGTHKPHKPHTHALAQRDNNFDSMKDYILKDLVRLPY